jgi:hypothetical protein
MNEPRQKAKVALFLELLFQLFLFLSLSGSNQNKTRNEVFPLLHLIIERMPAAKSLALQRVFLELLK